MPRLTGGILAARAAYRLERRSLLSSSVHEEEDEPQHTCVGVRVPKTLAALVTKQPGFRGRARGITRGFLARPARIALVVGLVLVGLAVDKVLNSSPFVTLLMTVGVGSILVTKWMFDELDFKKKE